MKTSKTVVIAEAGVNHNGSFELAKELIDVAVNAGADYVKFQTFKTEKLSAKTAKMADYQKSNLNLSKDRGQFDMLKALELDRSDFLKLKEYCEGKGIGFLSTPFDLDSLEMLMDFDLDLWKIASGEITNLPLLEAFAKTEKPIILSTGMCTKTEIEDAINVFQNAGYERNTITVLQCNTEYPTPYVDVHLNAMKDIASLGVKVGYSDHTLGVEIPIAAVALGATVVEKHFTLDRNMEGPDHRASLEPDELKSMVRMIRNTEFALGNKVKTPSPSEIKNIPIARKSIHLNRSVKKGEVITAEHFSMLRPGNGISPMHYPDLIGKVYTLDLNAGHMLTQLDFE